MNKVSVQLVLYFIRFDLLNYLKLIKLANDVGIKERLAVLGRKKDCTVIATAQSMDKLANQFLISLLNKGKLHAIQPHGRTR